MGNRLTLHRGPRCRGSLVGIRRLARLAAAFAFLSIGCPGILGAGAVPDISWPGAFGPTQGTFSRNEASRALITLHFDGQLPQVPIHWTLYQADRPLAARDTLISTAKRGAETVFTLPVPPLEPGKYRLALTADRENAIEERDERNNDASFGFTVPNGKPVRFRCEGPEGSVWEVQRVELNTSTGVPYPDAGGTRADTSRSTESAVVVGGIEPGSYVGVVFGPTKNRTPILVSDGTFEMSDPPAEMDVVWPRTTPYITGRPKVKGEAAEGLGGETGAPRWKWNTWFTLDGSVRNPTGRSADVQWLLRFVHSEGTQSTAKDTLLTLGALATEKIVLNGRIPKEPGNYLIQAEVRVPWPSGFEDLGDEDRVATHVLPMGWIEVER